MFDRRSSAFDAARQIHRRRHGADRLQLRRRGVAKLAGQLQREVAAERIPGDGDGCECDRAR